MGKRACAVGAASRRGCRRKAEGVARGKRASRLARAGRRRTPASHWLLEKARTERHGQALGGGTKGAIPLARDLVNQWEAKGGGFVARATAPG